MQQPRQGTLPAAPTRAIAALLQGHHDPMEMSGTESVTGVAIATGTETGRENASASGNGNANGKRRKSVSEQESEIDWRRGASEREAGREIVRRNATPILDVSGVGAESLAGKGSARAKEGGAEMTISLVNQGGMMHTSGQGAAPQHRRQRPRTGDVARRQYLVWRGAAKGKTDRRVPSPFQRGWRRTVV